MDEAQRRVARIMAKVADGIAHAHEHGVLHRDLKPDNVLLDEGDEPFIVDFGLAKIATSDARLTMTHAVVGIAISA